jgi:hypothetical protein
MVDANGSSQKGFEVPKVEVRFTKLFINGHFLDAVSGASRPRPFLYSSFRSQPVRLSSLLLTRRRRLRADAVSFVES